VSEVNDISHTGFIVNGVWNSKIAHSSKEESANIRPSPCKCSVNSSMLCMRDWIAATPSQHSNSCLHTVTRTPMLVNLVKSFECFSTSLYRMDTGRKVCLHFKTNQTEFVKVLMKGWLILHVSWASCVISNSKGRQCVWSDCQ
jgi:hypothetical protein